MMNEKDDVVCIIARRDHCLNEDEIDAVMRRNQVLEKQLSENEALRKRVAELERDNEELHKVNAAKARLIGVNNQLCKEASALRDTIASMQSKLAWTPVSDGLPTEPGWYELCPRGDSGCNETLLIFRCTGDEWIAHNGIDDVCGEPNTESWSPYVLRGLGGKIRRIELPKGGES